MSSTAHRRSPLSVDPVLTELKDQVEHLKAENARLERLLGLVGPRALPDEPARAPLFSGAPGAVDHASSSQDKLAFFRSLFVGRDDVYAVRWENERTGRSGWMPAVEGGFRRGQRNRMYLPLTDDVVTAHLTGEIHAGLYPLMAGDTCCLLACDFDGPAALLDALAYSKAARAFDVPTGLEISRSGSGAHVWMFFTGPVPAMVARRIGAGLLREAIAMRGELDLSSYDRLFPAQDYLPASGSIGNLIALPLQGDCRKRGTTVFLDLATIEPHHDQFSYLSSLERVVPRRATELAEALRPPAVGSEVVRLRTSTATRTHPPAPAVIRARLSASFSIERAGLPPALLSSLKHAASIHNPEFYKREKQRRSTFGVPRFIRCYREDLDFLHLPRGVSEIAEELIRQAGSRLEIIDDRPEHAPLELKFSGQLSPLQDAALQEMSVHELGVLEAPPGSGKTVVACALIARLGLPSLILVDRSALLDQWREQVHRFLGVKIGQLGGGRRKQTGVIDLASLQTLARRDDLGELLSGYGLVVSDECHHLPAATFEQAVRQIPARRWIGLTATPYRSDGLDQMILMQCGPLRHRVLGADDSTSSHGPVIRQVLVHSTSFTYETEAAPISLSVLQDIYRALVEDEQRNAAIVDDVREALERGRNCLVLTSRTSHAEILTAGLRKVGRTPVLLHGGLGAKAKRAAVQSLREPPHGDPVLAVATGPYLGEGFDCPVLDTLFLAFPTKFKGRVVQYVGRTLRTHPGKTSIEVHDYLDSKVPVLAYTHRERCKGYRSLGCGEPTYL